MARPAKPTDNLEKIRHLLGTIPDHQIAEMTGSTVSIVGRFRRRYGVSAYDGYKFGTGQAPPAVAKPAAKATKPAKATKVAALPVAAPVAKVDVKATKVDVKAAKADVKAAKAATKAAAKGAAKAVAAPVATAKAPVAAPAAPAKAVAAPAAKSGRVYTSKLDDLLSVVGVLPDREVAKMAGISTEGVRMYRRRHDIAMTPGGAKAGKAAKVVAAPVAKAAAAPAPARVAPPAVAPAVAPAAAPVASKAAVRGKVGGRRSAIDPYFDLLGTVPDREIAVMADVTIENVRAFRKRQGIASVFSREAAAPAAAAPAAATPAPAAPAKVAAPAAVAAPVAVAAAPVAAPVAVAAKPVAAPVAVAAAPVAVAAAPVAVAAAPVAKPVVAAKTTSQAASTEGYEVETKDGAGLVVGYIVVASNIADAAAKAQAAVGTARPGAQIVAIRHLGPALS